MRIEVAYARPDTQIVIPLEVSDGTTLAQAIVTSRLLDRFPDIDLNVTKVGVFGKLSQLDAPLREGDRVEIYRPLLADPKAVRKQRAVKNKPMKQKGTDGECGE
ncbi:MAG: RnfH family protein [Gammaproteobacteria bacterium]|nr:RnfH family protein [Gammaproteobacteria bacterium]MCP5424326.1 RnfH family protein [Gammaproteobacteria bacterium]MCP5459080.1 RnfH family protein [Gammaproteobacteria bacterium]